MKDRGWSVVIMDRGCGRTRQLSVSASSVRKAYLLGGVLGLLLLASIGMAIFGGVRQGRVAMLQSQNDALLRELADFERQVDSVGLQLDRIARQDARFRTVAGLEPVDDEALIAGVGGPGSLTLDSYLPNELDLDDKIQAFGVAAALSEAVRRADILSASLLEATASLEGQKELLESTPSILPAEGWISSGYSMERVHPIHGKEHPHYGIDISAIRGSEVWATAKGTVIRASNAQGYGLTVDIDHGHGFVTRYAHAEKLLVRRGQTVKRGDVIALVGDSGLSTAPHVHYEIWVDGIPRNPYNYFFPKEIRN